MAVATPVAYAAASGQRVLGGRFPIAPPVGAFPAVPTTGLVIGSVLAPAAGTPPCCMGAAFRQGDVAAGTTFSGVQMTAKNAWPDGSIKFALLAFGPSVAANTARPIGLTAGAAPGGAPLTTAQLRAFMSAPVSVTAGTFGSATWSGADWEAPFVQWVSGPLMSSWVYRRPIGSDAHLVAWLEVRLFIDGSVEVLPWVENGYLLVASPTNKNATYTVTLGGTLRFTGAIDLKHHQRTPLVSGAPLSYWLGADPGVTPTHDKVYLQATELVPSYMAVVDPASSAVTSLVSTFTPLQQGNFTYSADTMNSSGFAAPIGLLPNHDAVYLTTTAASAYAAVVRNGYSAGRYGIHYRDEATNRPLRFSSHPNRSANASSLGPSQEPPEATGTAAPSWNTSHSPSVGFLAYLLTGRWYFMEECQFAATANYLFKTDLQRNFADGFFEPQPNGVQVRECAWAFRTLVQALTVTPDDDTALRTEFRNSVEANINRYHARYVAAANNPLGFIEGDVDYALEPGRGANLYTFGQWQQDFVTAAWGMALAMRLPISSTAATRLDQFFAWKAQSVVGRLGPSDSYWYINAAPFELAVAPTDTPNWTTGTGPWFTTWRQVYDATVAYMAAGGGPAFGSTEGLLAGDVPGVNSYWGNLQPAIAYAVRHNVAGALAAYQRMSSASNWPTLMAAFNTLPVWSVAPASGLRPAWMSGAAVQQIVAIPNSTYSPNDALGGRFAFGNLVMAPNEVIDGPMGGHNDQSSNAIRGFSLAAATGWVERRPNTWNGSEQNVAYYADGSPASRHTYNTGHYSAVNSRVIWHGSPVVWGGAAASFPHSNGFNLATNTWDPPGEWVNAPDPGICQDGEGNVWAISSAPTRRVHKWIAATDSWVNRFLHNDGAVRPYAPMCADTRRSTLFCCRVLAGNLSAVLLTNDGTAGANVTFQPSAALSQFLAEAHEYGTMVYDPDGDRFLHFGERTSTIFEIRPTGGTTGWTMAVLATTGATMPIPTRTMGRLLHWPEQKSVILIPRPNAPMYIMRYA